MRNSTIIRQYAYLIMSSRHPQKFSASELAIEINLTYNTTFNRQQVYQALKRYSLTNKHFALYYLNGRRRVVFSVYLLTPPYC